MGDRSNIYVTGDSFGVYLYGHYMGPEYISILASALKRGVSRWDDPSYLTRIIFCEMIKDDVDGTTGFGISSKLEDNEYPILMVDCDTQTVSLKTDKGATLLEAPIAEFMEKPSVFARYLKCK